MRTIWPVLTFPRIRVWVRLYKRLENEWNSMQVLKDRETNVCVCVCARVCVHVCIIVF